MNGPLCEIADCGILWLMAAESSDNEISLEDLVGEVQASESQAGVDPLKAAAGLGASEAAASPPAPEKSAAPVKPSIAPVDESKVADITNLLAAEDPAFASLMSDLQKQGAQSSTEVDIDPLDLESIGKEKPPGRLRTFFGWLLRPIDKTMGEGHTFRSRIASLPGLILSGLRTFLLLIKSLMVSILRKIRETLERFRDLPGRAKLILIVAIGCGVFAVFILKFTLASRRAFFGFGNPFLHSFAERADATFTFDDRDPIEDFADPLFHPEHVVMMDKFIINLRRVRPDENPMGLFEFYIEASNQDSAVEIKDREGEMRDVIARAIEQTTYKDLVSVEGKEKLKVMLRQALNTILTRGQVRRVYFKSVVLKP